MAQISFPPSRAAAEARLAAFVPLAGRAYAEGRNHDLPGQEAVSRLSPYLRHRMLTEAEVIEAVLSRHSAQDCAKFIAEVQWRTYWKGWLDLRPSVWADYRSGLNAALNRVATEAALRAAVEAACNGETGIEGFDDWARDLTSTGYLHNHARMWFASIWIFTLHLPWQLGADFFLRQLLDGDPASNTLSWRWVAGLQTAGKTYLATPGNISAYTGGRFHPKGLATRADPLPGSMPPAPRAMPQGDRWDPALRTALVLHEDDLHPGFLIDAGLRPVATAFLAPQSRSPLKMAPRVGDFVQAAMADTAEVWGGRLGDLAFAPASLADWAAAQGVQQIVSPYAPVGPVADHLAQAGLPVLRALRPYDAAHWPHATHGFFRFREAVQRL